MGILYIVATPIGNIGDISTRAIEVLKSVDLILCEDTRTSSNLLNILNIRNKLVSYHKFNELERSREIIKELKEGKNIALITDAGSPCISDPGSILVNEAINNNIDIYSIPGPSAVITALTLSGLKINNFAFYGFLERKKSSQQKQLEKINANDIETLVFYESPKRIVDTLKNISEVFKNPYIILLNDLTKKFEKKYYGKANKILNDLISNDKYELGEYVIIVSKNKSKLENEEKLLPESILINILFKNKCTMKEAINLAVTNNKDYSKNEYYDASLNLKNFFK